jgi:hypothetical protein
MAMTHEHLPASESRKLADELAPLIQRAALAESSFGLGTTQEHKALQHAYNKLMGKHGHSPLNVATSMKVDIPTMDSFMADPEDYIWTCPKCGREYVGHAALEVKVNAAAHPNGQCFEDCPGNIDPRPERN